MATGDQKEALAQGLARARALAEQGEVKAALKLAERVRREALAAEDLPVLEQVLALARLVREQTEGKRAHEAGRLAYSARGNIRSVGHKQALAGGREWIDPFQTPPQGMASGAVPGFPPAALDNDSAPPGLEMLFLHLGVSLLVCAVLGVAPAFGSNVDVDTFVSWMIGCGVYWLVMAVLQVRWWRKGYEQFWRPTYSWLCTAGALVALSIPALLMFAVPWGEIASIVAFFLVLVGPIAGFLVFRPDDREWLLQVWKPYNTPLPPLSEDPVTPDQ